MMKKEKLSKYILNLFCLSFLTVFFHTFPLSSNQTQFLQIGTGAIEGTYYPIGRAIANIMSHPPDLPPCKPDQACGVTGLIAIAKATQGSVANLQLMKNGEIKSALCQADIANLAFIGKGIFGGDEQYKNLRMIAHLYTEHVHIIVSRKSNITKLSDLKGKRISIGTRDSGTILNAKVFLEYLGLQQNDFKEIYEVSSGQAADLMRDEKIDAFFLTAGYPVNVIETLASEKIADILSIDYRTAHELQTVHPYFGFENIPANVYTNISEKIVLTIPAIWVVDASVDTDLVYKMTKSLWNTANIKKLNQSHPQGLSIELQKAFRNSGVPLHEGAKKYYQEQQILDEETP